MRVAYTLEQCWHPVPGGTAVATLAVARALRAHGEVELVGVAGRHRHPPRAEFRPPIEVRPLPLARPWLYEAWNRLGCPRVERATGAVDVCHSTTAIPAATRAAHVVTVHDVAFVHTPERFTRHGVRTMTAGLERCHTADLVLCPSQATAADLAELGFPTERIRVVPWGVDPHRLGPGDLDRVRATYALPERFVLFVGTVEPRKNLARLADAVALAEPGLPLVVAGADGWGAAAPAGEHVRFLGFVPGDDLPALYAAATTFAYPSLEEGFGLPVAEAMAAGTPVVTSAGGATAEVAGGAAVLVDPADPETIAAGIRSALADPAEWAARGSARAAELTWERTAAATVGAYREAVLLHAERRAERRGR
ncbi:MAG TPA: glycosyltransferase family 1 protein [Ilumatobacter sp.]|nr:glycosyltransferase family 1 protein [Ilumatobacter sp.]